ncbi:MAG TPA: thiamine-phosphate kinase [Virgibacillus sp.]|nr:thiamine-phosphate kinase [Virgibacillus sp.]
MNEFSFINSIKQSHYKQSSLVKGVGDDGAVFRQQTQDIVTAVDTFVENIHFTRQTMPPFYIGYRALAANISDIAAMGGSPTFYLVSIIIPKTWSEKECLEIFSGMEEIGKEYRMDLIGGDTVSGSELAISITVIGYVNRGQARYRNLAKHHDVVFVTGTLGDSRAGLHMLLNQGDYINERYYKKRHQMPTPRVEFVNGLKSIPRMALNDISDGIANEAMEIAEASEVDICLVAEAIPVAQSFDQFTYQLQEKWKYFGGEDFEILGTVPTENWAQVQSVAAHVGVQVTEIGNVILPGTESGNVFLEKGSQVRSLTKSGYTHLR